MSASSSTMKDISVVGFFDSPDALLKAAAKVKEQNYEQWDVFTPYPVHGMDDAMGIKRSPIPYVTFVAGITGTCVAYTLQWWTSSIDWPLIVGGKPFNSVPAWVPVMFELTILFAGLSTFGAMMALCKLPNIKRRAVDPSLTNDRFAIVIESPPKSKAAELHYSGAISAEEVRDAENDAKAQDSAKSQKYRPFSETEAQALLRQVGAKEVRTVPVEGWF